MLPLGFAALMAGGVVAYAGITGSSFHSIVQGKPDKSRASGLSGGGSEATTNAATPGVTSSGTTSQSQSAVRKQVVRFFMGKGLTKAQAAGIAGNAQQESGLNPNEAGGGLFQDIEGRGAGAGASLQQQLESAWSELLGPESGALSHLRSTHTPQEAARVFSEQFERPGIPDLANREAYAQGAYAE